MQSYEQELPKFKKLDLSENISVTLPVHVWLSFMAAYSCSDWVSSAASIIAAAAQYEVLDPEWMKETYEQENIKEKFDQIKEMVSSDQETSQAGGVNMQSG